MTRNPLLLMLLLAGCQAGAGSGLTATLLLALAAGWWGCKGRDSGDDAAADIRREVPVMDLGAVDAIVDATVDAGTWETCCTDGRIASCWCALGGSRCNYGLGLTVCPDQTCGYANFVCASDAGVDGADAADAEAGLDAPDPSASAWEIRGP